jgi:S1-C subfamily serine protease
MLEVAMKNLICFLLVLPPIIFGQVSLTTAQIARKVSPSVVVIQGKTESGDVLGSGFIVSKDGKIVTNLHVIRDMKTASVQLANREIFDSVSVLAVDERRDLAIVKVAGFDLPVLALGNSDALTVGEAVVIVGSPRGLEGTVTAGILSSIRDSGDGFKVLQTDAAVNPGNSGGPLLNNKGQPIGVVSFKLRSAEGLNFAIPISYVRGLLNALQGPMSLEQMRRSLGGQAPSEQRSGPSLKETLDWLKEKIPLGVVQYVRSLNGRNVIQSVTLQATVWSLDSCTAIIGEVETTATSPGAGNQEADIFVSKERNTVPMGLLTSWSVEQRENTAETTNIVTFISGERMGYRLFLSSNSKDILRDLSFSSSQIPSKVFATERLNITFSDEVLARRIADAFQHAADLCRKKEAF